MLLKGLQPPWGPRQWGAICRGVTRLWDSPGFQPWGTGGWRWGGLYSSHGLRSQTASLHCCGPGTWLQVLETIGVLAVIANGMVIAFTSEFIPRVVYKYRYGPCREGANPGVE